MTDTTATTPERMLLTAKEAAATLAVSARLLWTLTNCGDIPCVRLGRAVRYDRRDLEAYVDRQKRRGARR